MHYISYFYCHFIVILSIYCWQPPLIPLYMALSEAAKETVYLRRFLKELGYNIETPTTIYCDNQGAQKITKNSVFHSRTKHIDIRHHFAREVYERGELDVQYMPTSEMGADMLIKSLIPVKHQNCCTIIGLNTV
ncbi:Retrovirus-related Pol polyprotein from transposon TNT 1-94, partial [Stegodyphus mimosarum]